MLTDWMCISVKEKEIEDDSKVFGLYNLRNGGTVYKAGENWAWSKFVGNGVGGNLKIAIGHPSKGVKSSWTHDSGI